MIRLQVPKTKLPLLFVAFAMLFAIPARADDAAALYKSKCAACHAPDGGGDTPAGKAMKVVDLRSPEIQKMTDDQLIAATANGKDKMPAYKGKITDDEIKQLVAYIRQLAKK